MIGPGPSNHEISFNGVFDHQVATLAPESFLAIRDFFMSEQNQKVAGVRWKDDEHGQKGFIFFEDRSYFEVWNEAKFNRYGYQDANRVETEDSLDKIAMIYGVQSGKFSSFKVAGRVGWTGDPRGGIFFIWQPSHVIDTQKNGIRQILNAVPASNDGRIGDDLIADYQLAGFKIDFLQEHRVAVATDQIGVRRIAVVTPGLTGNGLIALRFARAGSESEVLSIYDINGESQILLDLAPSAGTLILRNDLYGSASNFLTLP